MLTGGYPPCGFGWCPPECPTWRAWCSVERLRCPPCSPCLERYCSQTVSPIPESSASWVRCGVVCGWRDGRPPSLTQRNFSVRFRDRRGRAGYSPGHSLRGLFNGAVIWRLCEPQIASVNCYCTSFMEEVCLQSVYKVQIHPLQ